MQQELGLIGVVDSKIVDLPWDQVAMCPTEQAAYRLCRSCQRAPRTQRATAKLLKMSVGAFNTVLNSDQTDRIRHFSRKRQNDLQKICGNRAIDQWAELEAKGILNSQVKAEQREQEILKERAALDREYDEITRQKLSA